MTWIWLAPSTTWRLVRIQPFELKMKPDPEPRDPCPDRTWMVTTAGETFFTASVMAEVWSRRTLLTVVPPLVLEERAEVASCRSRLVIATALKLPESIPTTRAITTRGIQGLDARGGGRTGAVREVLMGEANDGCEPLDPSSGRCVMRSDCAAFLRNV